MKNSECVIEQERAKKLGRSFTPAGAALPLGILFGVTGIGMGAVWLTQKLPGLAGFLLATAAGALSLWAALVVWRGRYRAEIDLLSVKGWPLALAAFAATELIKFLFNTPALAGSSAAGAAFWLVWFVAFTGVAEELWWRGVWFAVWRGRPFACIVAGSVLFGVMHIMQNDLGSVLVITGIGLVLGAARYRGASIGALALVHGIAFNWFNNNVIKWNERALPMLGESRASALYFVLCAVTAVLIYRFGPGAARGRSSAQA